MKPVTVTKRRPALRRFARAVLPSKRAIARSLLSAVVSTSLDIGRLAGDR
jgi:hypothetical protein